ncbi:MAG: MFS transporter [Candidatus Kariarchaeaceae archaeon]
MSLLLIVMSTIVSLIILNWGYELIIEWKESFVEPEGIKPEKPTLTSVIKYNSDYFNLWLGQLFSNFGGVISMIALLLYIISIDESPMALAWYGIFQAIPMIFLSPVAGVFVDRWDRKKIMVISDLLQALCIALLPFISYLWQIYLITFLTSSINRFFYPARNAAIPNLVNKDELLPANSLSTLSFQLIFLIGPAIGGVLIALTGYSIAFWLDSFTFIISAFFLYFIKTDLRPTHVITNQTNKKSEEGISRMEKKTISGEFRSVLLDVKLGFKYVRNYKLIWFLFSVFMFYSLCAGMVGQLWPNFMKVELGLSDIDFGLALSVFAFSGVLGSFAVSALGSKFDKLGLLIVAVAFDGVFIIILGLVTTLNQLFIIMLFYGVISMLFEIPLVTLMQEAIRDDMRGRVNSMLNQVFSIFRVVSVIIGSVLATGFDFTFFSYEISLKGTGVGGAFVYAGVGVALLGLFSFY